MTRVVFTIKNEYLHFLEWDKAERYMNHLIHCSDNNLFNVDYNSDLGIVYGDTSDFNKIIKIFSTKEFMEFYCIEKRESKILLN